MRLLLVICFLLKGYISFSQNFHPDIAVNRIALEDSVSAVNILGKDSWNALTESSEIPKTIVFNKDKSEKMELIFHEGNAKNCYSEFRIIKRLKGDVVNNEKTLLMKDDHFESSKGIRLGLNPKMVEEKLGFKLAEKQGKNGDLILHFRKDIAKDPAFKRYNMPVYYGEYIFRNNRLIEFSFGFEVI